MCLIDYRKTTEEERSGVGYKIFRKTSNRRLAGEFGSIRDKKILRPVGKWLGKDGFAASPGLSLGSYYSRVEYKPGWHVYLERPNLKDHHIFSVRKIKYRKARLIGKCLNWKSFTHIKSVVADEIFIERKNG